MIADFLIPNSPSVTASRATSPYTGEANTPAVFICIISVILFDCYYGSVYPLHECDFAVLQSKIAAVGSKAKFHI